MHSGSNVGSSMGGGGSFSTSSTQSFGRGGQTHHTHASTGSQRVGRGAITFISLIFFLPFIIGFITVFSTIMGGTGGFAPHDRDNAGGHQNNLNATVMSGATWAPTRNHNTGAYSVRVTGRLQNTGRDDIRTAVIYFDLFDNQNNIYMTIHLIINDLGRHEIREFSHTIPTHNHIRPSSARVNRVESHATLFHPTSADVIAWNFTLMTNPPAVTYSIQVRNNTNYTISVELLVGIYNHTTRIADFVITVPVIGPYGLGFPTLTQQLPGVHLIHGVTSFTLVSMTVI